MVTFGRQKRDQVINFNITWNSLGTGKYQAGWGWRDMMRWSVTYVRSTGTGNFQDLSCLHSGATGPLGCCQTITEWLHRWEANFLESNAEGARDKGTSCGQSALKWFPKTSYDNGYKKRHSNGNKHSAVRTVRDSGEMVMCMQVYVQTYFNFNY